MISVKSISAALNSVDEKKEDLREAFENLQFHSSSLASFTLKWKDIEEHFDSILKSMEGQLKDLESKEKQAANSLPQKISPSEIESKVSCAEFQLKKSEKLQVTPYSELKSLCVNMDGKGLLSFVSHYLSKHRPTVRAELAVALQYASDPTKLVLDAIQALYPLCSMDKAGKIITLRASVLLLEQLASISPQIKPQEKEKAKKLAVEWKGLLMSGQQSWRIIAFLLLLATYDLVSAFNTAELVDLMTLIVRRVEAVHLFRVLNIPDKAPDLIEKLISKKKQKDAVKFVYAFNLVERFPPGPLLKEYVEELKKIADNSTLPQHVAMSKEASRLKAVSECIKEYNLESEFADHPLFKTVEWLEKKKELKRITSEKAQQKQKSGKKRPRHVPSETDQSTPYLAASGRLYGSRGSTPPPFAVYTSSSIAPYGLAGTHMGYGGYGLLPQYHPPYYF